MASLSGEVGGLEMKNPVILAAGILGTTGASLRRAALAGAGAVVTKSVGTEPRSGHPGPTVVDVDCGLINAMGLPGPGYKSFQEEIDIARTAGAPVVASIFGSSPEEFAVVAAGIKADAYELNLSCPHAKCYGAELGRHPDVVESVTRTVKSSVGSPVWVKLTPNVSDIVELGLAAQRGGADAVVAINTLKAMAIDIESGYPILGNKFGGLSGPAIKPVAVKCVYDLSSALDIPVIGVGGISSWEDAVEMIMAGARGVQVGTALSRGYGVFSEISQGISSYLERKCLALSDLCGMARRQP
ncbi:MAG TPA: dihydroorotate dehydrogenase [Methanotrichaceae archaeon]|nr:dihydroorotate dehydrogenase [Methanotrichaceae archaeon]